MKKSLLAIAIAAAVPAVASAQVTVFGVMDAGYRGTTEETTTGTSRTEVSRNSTGGNAVGSMSANRLGFRGTEKIGNLTAGFFYELGMDAGDTGNLQTGPVNQLTGVPAVGNLGGAGVRRSVVSLAGGFGTVEIGRDYTPVFLTALAFDAAMASNLQVGKTVYLNGGTTITTVRNSGQAMWTSPTMGGITARVAITNKTNDPSATNDVESTGGSLRYAAGPLVIQAGFNNQKDNSSATVARDRDETVIGASYVASKQLTLLGMWGEVKQKNATADYSAYQLGARYMVAANTMFHGSFGKGDGHNGDFSGYNIGLRQMLSKRTTLYAMYGADELKGATSKRERTEFAFGINHSF